MTAPATRPDRQLTEEEVNGLARRIEERLFDPERSERAVTLAQKDLGGGRMVIEVREERTDRLIAQFPPESLLKMSDKLEEIAGLLFDRKS